MLVDLRPGLRNYLLSNASIAAMVGTRIYPVIAQQGIRDDLIVYNTISEIEGYHFRGPSGLVLSRYQIDAWSQSATRAAQLADLIKEHLGGASGAWSYGGSSPNDFVNVQGVFLQTGDTDYDNEVQMYRNRRDYMIAYEDQG
jgi:hypothetical protein